jgi:sugar lactone lactonase YvrE
MQTKNFLTHHTQRRSSNTNRVRVSHVHGIEVCCAYKIYTTPLRLIGIRRIKMKHYKSWLIAGVGILTLFCLSVTALAQPAGDVPDEIIIEHHNLFPEGIEYDAARQRFLLSSFSEGTIYQVTDDGTISAFIEDDNLTSTVGIEIDHVNNRLLVANGDTSFSPNTAMLGAYDLETGERLFFVDLSEVYPADMHLANDVAVDRQGVAYVTDTFAPVIYRVDMDGTVSVFMADETLAFINGITVHADGYLLLGAYPNLLLKIPLDEPELMPVELGNGIEFEVTDGMVLHPDGSLVMVTFPDSIIYRLRSDDDWVSATLVSTSRDHAAGWGTTVALRGESIYVIHSYLNRLMDEMGDQDIFEIVRVEFEED